MEWSGSIAATAGGVLSQNGGNDGRVMQEVGGTLCTPHVVGDKIRAYFGLRRKVDSTDVLKRIAREGVPAESHAGRTLRIEL